MPEGRMLNRSVSVSEQIAELRTDTARMLHAWTVSHVDRDGLITAAPNLYKARVCPMLDHVTAVQCASVLCDWVRVRLAYAYLDARDQRVIWLCGFRRQQHRSWRWDREAPSSFGPPLDRDIRRLFELGSKLTTVDLLQTHSGVAPQWLSESAGCVVDQLSWLSQDSRLTSTSPTSNDNPEERPQLQSNSVATLELHTHKVREGKRSIREVKCAAGRARTRAHTRAREEPAAAATEVECIKNDHSPIATQVLDELKSHPALTRIATLAMAEQGLTNMAIAGGGVGNVEAVLIAVRDLARKAGTAEAMGESWSDKDLVGRFVSFTSYPLRRHTTMRPPGQGGDTPERQAEAEKNWLESPERAELEKQAKESGF